MNKLVTINAQINDSVYLFGSDLSIFQACLEKNIVLPRFCYHNSLSIAGNCRICCVEEKKSTKLILACATMLEQEASIFTETALVVQARKDVLEYLLANHPLDCAVCDQGGECDLQDQFNLFGSVIGGRFYETIKRAVSGRNFTSLIKFSLDRCIHCARCTRFFNEVTETNLIFLLGRGFFTEISYYSSDLVELDELSGNVIDLCPVGALTSKVYSYVGRLWDYVDFKYVDIFDDFHSSLRVDCRGSQIVRILPNANYLVNEEWISDKVRFSYDAYRRNRLRRPCLVIKERYRYFYISWLNCLFFIKYFILSIIRFSFIKKKYNYYFISAIDKFSDIFSLYVSKLISNYYGSIATYSKLKNLFFSSFSDFRLNYINNIKLNDLESNDEMNIIFLNTNIRFESPVVGLKFKKFFKEKLNFTFFNFGVYSLFLSSQIVCLGTNFFYLHKNLFLAAYFFYYVNSSFVFGTSFFYNKLYLTFFYSFKNFIFRVFSFNVFFNFVTCLSNRVSVFEMSIMSKKEANYLTFNPFIFYNVDCEFFYNFFLHMNHLKIYQGHHIDYFSKHSDMVLPIKFFVERSDFLINSEGFVNSLLYSYFRYNLGLIKDSWSVMLFFFNLLSGGMRGGAFGMNFLLNSLKTISPIFANSKIGGFFDVQAGYKNTFLGDRFVFLKNFLINFFINNFHTSDTISRSSLLMALEGRKYLLKNDFRFYFSFVFFNSNTVD